MNDSGETGSRRTFLIRSVAGAVGAASVALLPAAAAAASNDTRQSELAALGAADANVAGYEWLRPSEQAFVEALVDHLCPADNLSPGGVDMGLNIFFDRALAGAWGQGDRLYLQGPFKLGSENQGYQLGMTPAALFRAGTEGLGQYCQTMYQKGFDALTPADKEYVLKGLLAGSISLPNGVPVSTYFAQLLQMFYEAMFSDPIYGGNRNKIAWKMIGYPGVNTNNRLNIVRFKNKPYSPEPKSIADVS